MLRRLTRRRSAGPGVRSEVLTSVPFPRQFERGRSANKAQPDGVDQESPEAASTGEDGQRGDVGGALQAPRKVLKFPPA